MSVAGLERAAAGRPLAPFVKSGPAPEPPDDRLLTLDRLTKAYRGGAPVLRDISLSVGNGETVALIGPNGSGKSTLLRSLVGLHDNDAGTVNLFGQRFGRRATGEQRRIIRRRIGFVFQAHGLVSRLSALSNVVQGLIGRPGGWRAWNQAIAPAEWRREAMAALAAVRLEHKAATRADRLSGGQAQRVAIARALVSGPRLLIADEPAASLDPAAGHDVMRQFAALARERGITLIFTSHDMEHAVTYADRVVALKGGTILFDRPSGAVSSGDLEGVFDG